MVDGVGAVLEAVGVAVQQTHAGVVQEEGVAPQQWPNDLI